MSKRTITLTGRPPVSINEDTWPLLASAKDEEHDGQVRCQANRISKWFVGVRQHEDGRAIVYAVYDYSTNWQGARDFHAANGQLLPAGCTNKQICEAIEYVCQLMETAESYGEDGQRWPTLAAECIADMPAEDIDSPTL